MNMIGKLVGVEWIKARKRSVFWIAIIIHAAVIAIALGGRQYMYHVDPRRGAFHLPADWSDANDVGTSVGMLMLFISVALLTASEATWRTQRQNVIDGLSRGQYFCGKLMLVLLLALILWVDIWLLALIIAPMGGPGALASPLLSPLAQHLIPAALLYFLAIGATAFMFGMLASSSGAAIALVLSFIIIEPIVGGIMSFQSGLWPSIARFLPLTVFKNITTPALYDPQLFARLSKSPLYTKLGRPLPLTAQTSIITTVIYILAFITITWLAFRTRDL